MPEESLVKAAANELLERTKQVRLERNGTMSSNQRRRSRLFSKMASHLMGIRSDFLHRALELVLRHS
jgi:hypothetical protein